jgi:hypothetical protein
LKEGEAKKRWQECVWLKEKTFKENAVKMTASEKVNSVAIIFTNHF